MFRSTFFVRLVNTVLCINLAAFTLGCKEVDLQQINQALIQYQQPLDEKTVIAGLKQALEIGTSNSVSKTSQKGGFSNNPLIRIAIPEPLDKTAKTLKKAGLGRYVDKFENQMNRAAEIASTEAKAVFINSISQMSLADGWNILRGPNDAATQYFKNTTSAQLELKFQPIIKRSMAKIGFYSDYQKLLKTYDALPFTDKPDMNIENYVLEKSLNGLFTLVAEEEKKIRLDPAARVTDLLKRVFSN